MLAKRAEGEIVTYIQPINSPRTLPSIARAYERLIAAMGSEEFGAAAHEAVLSVTSGVRRLYLFEVQGREAADLRYSFVEPGVDELIPIYRKCYLPLDPVHEAVRATPAGSDMVLQRVRPADIALGAFRRRFFDEAGIVERVSIVQHGSDGWRVMSVARHESDGCFSDLELEAIAGLGWLILPMLQLTRRTAGPRQLSTAQLEARFATRFPDLTKREREVCARAAIGMTVEASALDLGIAKTSVLTYRQRAYQRLGVTSPFELSSLVTH